MANSSNLEKRDFFEGSYRISHFVSRLGLISAKGGDALQHKIREPYNDEIKQKSQKGYGSSGKDYDR